MEWQGDMAQTVGSLGCKKNGYSREAGREDAMAINSKSKGKRGELEWASFCRAEGYNVRRGQQYSGIEGEDVVGLPGIHCEVKRTEKLNIYDAMAQACRDATNKGKIPIVAHRRNFSDWLVIMRAEDWFQLYREWESGIFVTHKEVPK